MPLALGDYKYGDSIDFHFSTHAADGTPTALVGPTLSVYKGNSTADSVIGVTLDVNFDLKQGFNHVRIDTSQPGGFYLPDADYTVVLTAGTVGGVSVIGYVVARFTLEHSVLGPDGLDAIVIESGLNARQALSLIAAAASGDIDAIDGGSGSWTFTIAGAGVATTRIVAVANVNTKTRDVTITPPS